MTDRHLALQGEELVEILKQTLAKGACFRFKAHGFSMAPFIKDGDIITVSPKAESMPVGSVAAFLHPSHKGLVVHRVVALKSTGYFIKADNSAGSDGIVSRDDIIGVMTAVERDGKRIALGLGGERRFIAFLSRINILHPVLCVLRSCKKGLLLLKK